MYVIDLNGNQYAAQLDTSETLELNGNRVLSATIVPSKVNRVYMDEIDRMWSVVDQDDIEYKIVYLRKRGEGSLATIEIKAIPLFYDTMDNMRLYEVYNEHMTANRCFTLIFKDTGFSFILVNNFPAIDWEGFGKGDSRLELFKRALDRYGAEFRIVGNVVYLEDKIGRDTQFQYRHRLNASDIAEETDANAFWTYAIGYGNYEEEGEESGGYLEAKLIREYTSPLAQIPGIGIREAPPIMDGRVTDRATMDASLKRLVDESLNISISANIHDLRRQGYALAQPELGDRVFVIDERIGLTEEVRVVSMTIERNWRREITNLDLTFGSPGISRRHQSSLSTAQKAITELIEGKRKLPPSVYDVRIWEATKAMQNVRTELTIPENGGLMAVDKDNPNNVVILNSNGLFVSDDGGATPKQAIWGGGINATVITAGTMLADRIAGGVLSSLNDNFELNMNTGNMISRNASWTLGNGARIRFSDTSNRIIYTINDPGGSQIRTSGLAVGNSLNERLPFVALGTSLGNNLFVRDEENFTGFIANTNARMNLESIGNSVVGNIFHVRDKAIDFSKGFLYNLNPTSSSAYFTPINTGLYDYELGRENNRFNVGYIRTVYGTLAGTSTYNAKMNIEDIDGRMAYDYFDMMVIKSYYYKDEDYTNRFNKRVSPIIEQLDPTLENLYKASPEALDINSNLWLLAQAFKYYVEQTNIRLDVLENESTTS